MISILMPTRKRVEWFTRAINSIRDTAANDVEIVVWIDDDDMASVKKAYELGVKYIVRPRIHNVSDTWNKLAEIATGDILGQSSDDFVFRSKGWDIEIEAAYASCSDKILMVHGTDGGVHAGNFSVHTFISRRWIEVVGRCHPPYFPADLADTWLNDIANYIGRRKYLPNVVIEHMHSSLGKAISDDTHKEGRARLATKDYYGMYYAMADERIQEAEKLKAAMY